MKKAIVSIILVALILFISSVDSFAADEAAVTEQSAEETINLDDSELLKEALIRSVITEEEEIILAKMIYGEDRNSTMDRRAAVIWSVFNRMDCETEWGDTVKTVVYHSQFHGYTGSKPVKKWAVWLVRDVALRYALEKAGYSNVGRTLPKEFKFMSADGLGNKFRRDYKDKRKRSIRYWDWSLESPYEDMEYYEKLFSDESIY